VIARTGCVSLWGEEGVPVLALPVAALLPLQAVRMGCARRGAKGTLGGPFDGIMYLESEVEGMT
jgi:hypothetical protein